MVFKLRRGFFLSFSLSDTPHYETCRLKCRRDGCGQLWELSVLGNQAEHLAVQINHIMVGIYLGLKLET